MIGFSLKIADLIDSFYSLSTISRILTFMKYASKMYINIYCSHLFRKTRENQLIWNIIFCGILYINVDSDSRPTLIQELDPLNIRLLILPNSPVILFHISYLVLSFIYYDNDMNSAFCVRNLHCDFCESKCIFLNASGSFSVAFY